MLQRGFDIKSKIPEVDHIISALLEIDPLNVFSSFCWPWIWTETSASYFYKKKLYARAITAYPKLRIARKFIRALAVLIYYKLKSSFFKKNDIQGSLKEDTELLILDWYRGAENIFQKDPYYGTLFAELTQQKRKFQVFLIPLHQKDPGLVVLKENDQVICYERSDWGLPSWSFIGKLIVKNFRFFQSYRLSFWEKIIFFTSFINKEFLDCIGLSEHLSVFFTKTAKLKRILMLWESQPHQKAFCLQAHQRGIRVYGYIHSDFWPDGIAYARLFSKEYAKALPDKLFLHGNDYKSLFMGFGWEEKDLILIKSQRYDSLLGLEYFLGKFFLPYDKREALYCIQVVKKALAQGLFKIKQVQAHPVFAQDKEIRSAIKTIILDENARDVVVGGTTTISLQALSVGLEIFNVALNPIVQMFELGSFQGVVIEQKTEHIFKTKLVDDPQDKFFIFSQEHKKMITYL